MLEMSYDVAQVIADVLKMRAAGARPAEVVQKLKSLGLRSSDKVGCVGQPPLAWLCTKSLLFSPDLRPESVTVLS
jgi:hypothetical protein